MLPSRLNATDNLMQKRLLKVGLLVVVLGLILTFPARVAYRWFAPAEFVASGISGTVWNGQAQEATINGFYLRQLNWEMQVSRLLTGKVAFDLDTKFASGFAEGSIAFGFGGSLYANDFSGALPLEAIQSIPAIGGTRGMLSTEIVELQVSDGIPVVADGYLEIAGLSNPMLHREPIGGFRAEFFSQDSGIVASIEDTAAVIDLAGSLQLSADGTYEFLAQISPVDSTPSAIREQLRFLGSANDRGQHELRLEGSL